MLSEEDPNFTEMVEAAEAAIEADKTHTGLYEPGVWHVVEYGDDTSPGICVHSGDTWRVCFMATIQSRKDYEQQMAKAQHIALSNPQAVLKLHAALVEARRERDELRDFRDQIIKHYPNQDMNHLDFRVNAYQHAMTLEDSENE